MRYFCCLTLIFLSIFCSRPASAQNYQAALRDKRLVLAGASCAGWSFISNESAVRYDESICAVNGEASGHFRIRWVSPNVFMLVRSDRQNVNETCPPQNFIYSVEKISDSKVTLKSVWTGWNVFDDEVEQYTVQKLNKSGKQIASAPAS
jgi:hypothetical protein